MYIKINAISLSIVFICTIAMVTDLLYSKIYNVLTVSGFFLGVIIHFLDLGPKGFIYSISGASVAFLICVPLYLTSIFAGGDFKLFVALGALGGVSYFFNTLQLSILVGCAFALVQLAVNRKLFDFLRRVFRSFLSFVIRPLDSHLPKIDKSTKMPYAIPIGVAAIAEVFFHPLKNWGLNLW
ncbi:MAG: hypothetical protein CL678_10125 [Bdellovibrionaceae bacterium]|nr:hypothetical protein [Pseudobdellovibrionaceae bacterium]|tara:strand:- start:3361 stop:3906 length:546 start_codon:yes stop_codon:yes gene_type:complete